MGAGGGGEIMGSGRRRTMRLRWIRKDNCQFPAQIFSPSSPQGGVRGTGGGGGGGSFT